MIGARKLALRLFLGATLAVAQVDAQGPQASQITSGSVFSGTVRLVDGTALPPLVLPANTSGCTATDASALYPVQVILTPGRLALNGHGRDQISFICLIGSRLISNPQRTAVTGEAQ